jgi:hypothetical protein
VPFVSEVVKKIVGSVDDNLSVVVVNEVVGAIDDNAWVTLTI